MDTYQIEIINPKAKKLLDDLANMNLITVRPIEDDSQDGRRGQNGGERTAIMSLAGSWREMSGTDFQEYLSEAKRSGSEIFDREAAL